MWTRIPVSLQHSSLMTFFILQLLGFGTLCACGYKRRHSWREVVPSHGGPLGVWARWCQARFDLSCSKAKPQKPWVNAEQHLSLQHSAGTLFWGGGSHFETASRAVSAGQTAAAEALLACATWKLVGVLVRSNTFLGHTSLKPLQKTKFFWFMTVSFS